MTALTACGKKSNKIVNGEIIEFSGFDLNSDELVKNEMLKKEINLVSVWQNPCPPCKIELEAMEKLYQENSEIGFIGLSVSDNSQEVVDTLEDWGISFQNYRIDPDFLVKNQDTLNKTPSLYFVNSEGREIFPLQVGQFKENATVEEVVGHLENLIKDAKDEK